jgi:phthiocerol/phenolphthiocerol synthesis type-I polyketide synthase C
MSLWSGESTLALAGGVNILMKPLPFVGFCKASMLAPDGRCKSFDAAGDGFVRAEGGVVLVLKPLAAAERDGNPIHGLVLATGVNSDGRTRGLSLPNEAAQESLLREVYSTGGISPQDVFYIEAHGTGTAAGDSIECNAIGRVVGAACDNGDVCHIGSIKSNVGHLEPASGVAGIAKVLLALKHREIPPNLHFNTPNPKIEFEKLKLKVVVDPIPLPEREQPYVMGINSFGFGGTNAHIAIQEYVRQPAPRQPTEGSNDGGALRPSLLLLSAHNIEALSAMAANYAHLLRDPAAPLLGEICATAALRRSALPSRLAALARTPRNWLNDSSVLLRARCRKASESAGSRRRKALRQPSSFVAMDPNGGGWAANSSILPKNFAPRSPRSIRNSLRLPAGQS